MSHLSPSTALFAVVPVLTGPLQVLLALLPALLAALGGLLLSMFRPRAMLTGLKLLWRLKVSLCVILLAIVGLVAGLRTRFAQSSTTGLPIADSTASHDWPLARGDLARTGAAPGGESPTQGGIVWNWKRDGAAVFSSPAVVGERLYFTSATLSALGSGGSGQIHCLDADSGQELWQFSPPEYRATFSSPVLAGDYLVCGEGLHYVRDARVVCVNLRESRLAWTYTTNSHVECTPVIHQQRVYVGAGDDGYYCFELEPDATGQARLVWHVPGENYSDAETSLAVWTNTDGRTFVLAGLGLGGKALCVLDAATGQELRRIPTDYPVFSPPAISDNKLYVGMGNGDYVHTAEDLGQPLGGAVWCFDLENLPLPLGGRRGEVAWKYATSDTVLGAVAVIGDEVYFASRDGLLQSIDRRTGQRRAVWDARAAIVTSPAVTEKHVYVLTDAGVIYGLDRFSLVPFWESRIASGPLLISSPIVAHGHVYVGSEHDGLICAGIPGKSEQPFWGSPLGGPGFAGNRRDEPLPPRGAFAWNYPSEQMGQSQESIVTAPLAAMGDWLYVPLAGNELNGLAALNIATLSDEAPKPAWFYPTPNPVVLSPVSDGVITTLVDGRPGDTGRHLHSVTDGIAKWKTPVAADATGTFVVDRKHIVVQDRARSLACYGPEELWRRDVGSIEHGLVIHGQMLVAASTEPVLAAFDLPSGEPLWQVPLSSPPTASPVVARHTVFLGTREQLESRSLVNGRPQPGWPAQLPGVASELVMRNEWIAYVSGGGELIVVNRETGALRRRVPGAMPGITPTTSRDLLLYAGPTALWQLSPAGDAMPTAWAETDWLGVPATSPIVNQGQVYMGRRGWGLVRFGAAQ